MRIRYCEKWVSAAVRGGLVCDAVRDESGYKHWLPCGVSCCEGWVGV